MTIPCEQQDNIIHISKTLERMENAHDLDRKERRESEKKLMSVLERLADQAVRINHLEETADERFSIDRENEARIRKIELAIAEAGPAARQEMVESLNNVTEKLGTTSVKVDELSKFFYLTTHKYAVMAYASLLGMVLSGTLLDLIYHMDTIHKVITFFKIF